jgi:hypothetical protein
MSRTRWAVDGPDGTTVELDGRKFGASDEGAPMLVSNRRLASYFQNPDYGGVSSAQWFVTA